MAIKTRPMPKLYCSYFAKNPEIDTDKGYLSEWQYNTVSGQIRLTNPKTWNVNKKYYVPQANGKTIYYNRTMFKNSKNISFIDFQHVPVYDNSLEQAFWGCYYIADVRNINNNVTNMSRCFQYIRTNINVKLPSNLSDMSDIFYNAYMLNRTIRIPNKVTNMSRSYANCVIYNQATSIPDSVVDLSSCFLDCFNLNTTIAIGNSVQKMGSTFSQCLNFNQSVTIPKSVIIMNSCFYNCVNLSSSVTVYSTELTGTHRTFWRTYNANKPKPINVHIYYEYANGVKTKTYNLVVANSNANYKWHGSYGVTVVNMGRAPW